LFTFNYTLGTGQNTNALAGGTAATLTLSTPGGANSLGLNKAIVIETTPPTITSIARQTPSGQTTSSIVVTFRVAYSEPVTVPGTANFAVVAVNGTTRDVTVSITSGTGGTGGTGEFRLRGVN